VSRVRRIAVVALLVVAAAFGIAAVDQPSPPAADSVMGSETR
jgi:hypothetical protein